MIDNFENNPSSALEEFFEPKKFVITHLKDKGYESYSGLGWHILIKQPKNIAFQPAYELQRKTLIWGLILASIFSLIGANIAEILTKPLLKIAQEADKISNGERHEFITGFYDKLNLEDMTIYNEVLLLSLSLKKLVDTLIKQERNLKVVNEELEEKIKARTEDLQIAKEVAEKANKAKSIFLSNMSHELLTPLNAILGFSQLMMDDEQLTLENKQNLKIICNSGEHLLSLINEVLEISKIEAERVTLNENIFDIYELLYSLKSMLQIRATEKNIDLLLRINNKLPKLIVTDESKLRQILLNLVSNSLKFTKEGSITISTESRGENQLYFSVADTGKGMKPEEINQLFTPFYQTESGKESKQGTGLGLVISQQLVQMMGGEMTVKSVFNKGTTFEFTVNFNPVSAISDQKTLSENKKIVGLVSPIRNYRILIVDDEKYNRLLLAKLLQPLGLEIEEAVDGEEALEKWKNWQPHVIWMDIGMPKMNGYDATESIRNLEKQSSHKTFIIALTAHSEEEGYSICKTSGMKGYLTKPIKPDNLRNILKKYLSFSS